MGGRSCRKMSCLYPRSSRWSCPSSRFSMSGVHIEEERVRGVVSHSVLEPAFLSLLAQYRRLLSSVYGPRGTSILVCNAAGREVLVSSSSEIIKELSFAHPCVKYINAVISSQNASCGLNGLYAGMLCVRLLEETLKCEEDLPYSVISCISEDLVTYLLDQLAESPVQVVMDLDIGDMNQVMSFVKTILGAKTILNLNPQTLDSLSLNIIKSFLKSVPNEYSSEGFGHVAVITQEDSSSVKSQVFDGVLYREPDLCPKKIARFKGQSNIKLLLFTVALSYKEDETVSVRWGGRGTKEENFVSTVLPCLTAAMKDRDVHILANQKPVDPVIKFELERGGWLVLERLGSNAAEAVEKLSGCHPITSLAHLPHQLTAAALGTLTSVEHVVYADKSYLLLDRCEGTVSSLLLPAVIPSVLSTLKETVESCLAALRMVVVDGKVVAGGGCLEVWAASCLTHRLASLTHPPGTTPHHLAKVGSAFVKVLMELALMPSGGLAAKLDWSVDSAFHHLWHTPPNIVKEVGTTGTAQPSIPEHCVCGLVQREAVRYKYGGDWQPLEIKMNLVPGHSSWGRRGGKTSKLTGVLEEEDENGGSLCSNSDDRLGGQCMEEDSLEGSQTTSEEEIDSLEKVVNSQEGEIDSLEGKLESFDDDDEDSLEGLLDKAVEQDSEPKDKIPTVATLEGHVPGALYDSFPAKFNAIRLALEGFTQLLHIGQCVFDQ